MAKLPYRVIQEPLYNGTLTKEQVQEAVRAAIAVIEKRKARKKSRPSVDKAVALAKA